MLDLNELEQLIAFADTGTLSKVAEAFHISTPSVTRSMKNIEEEFGVFLFHRTKMKPERLLWNVPESFWKKPIMQFKE